MKTRLLLVVVLFFILGSAIVNSIDSFSYTFKTVFYGIAMTVLLVIGVTALFRYFKKTKY